MSEARGMAHLVVFRVAGDRYAVRSDRVERVLERTTIESLPWLPRTVAGVLRDGDVWLPVVDPVAALDPARTAVSRSTVLVLLRGGSRYGIGVDEAMGRRELRAHRLQEGEAARTVTRFEDLEGVVVLSDDDGLIMLLDPDRLFKAEAGAAVAERSRERHADVAISIVSFRAGGADLGLHVGQVSEVLPWREPDDAADGSGFMIGSLELREHRVPVLDLDRLFGIGHRPARDEDSRILIVEIAGERYGLAVRQVSDVERLPADAVSAAPRFLRRLAGDSIDAVARVDERLLLLLDLDRLIALAHARGAAEAAEEHGSRSRA